MYFIADDQFNDVVLQENDRPVDRTRFVPTFEELKQKSEIVLPGNRLYGHLLRVGEQGNWPVITFTTQRDLPCNAPSKAYLEVIVAGIKEAYPLMTNERIGEYLSRTEGIKGHISQKQIASWVEDIP